MIDKETYNKILGTISKSIPVSIYQHEITCRIDADILDICNAINRTIDRIKKDTNADIYVVKSYIVDSGHPCFAHPVENAPDTIIIQLIAIPKIEKETK